ncbi:MAG: alpha/beta fold hydrolase [Bacteriovoracaceae bacterium]|nr:alpha/beta fold hydrolase [Bacteriovoracaceae bacterium]
MKNLFSILLLGLSLSAFGDYKDVDTYEEHKQNFKYQLIDQYKFAYIDEGAGPVIVLLHGIPTNSWMYRKMIEPLVAKGYRVIAPDLLGMGGSSRSSDPMELSVKSQARLLLILLKDKLKLKDWTHVVHDFAGPITWEMAELDGFNINKLIVLDTFAFEKGWNPGLNIFTKVFMNLVTTKPLRKIFFTNAIKSMMKETDTMSKAELRQLTEGYVLPLQQGASDTYKSLYFSANKLKKELPRYQRTLNKLSTIPSKIIWGRSDKFLSSTDQLEQIKAALKTEDKDILVLQNAKHLITEEAPIEIVNFID